ncbi:exonuclease SbcCD subunit D [Enterococcus sp. 669A]|uniref:Nuclease SbcCD subunit D n=1 Tax=Candidatus Enterococcus moelleringii TaxID=2815325 RepID=A0ABS3LFC4_9ENTE|nr:exonuclease SbcCD subunit D [Enterococcus sp. 669A]
MRFLHTADWHIGKKLHGYDLLEDQAFILKQILTVAKAEKVDAIVIAGDLYDRSVPSEDGVRLLNQTIAAMNLTEGIPLLAISGNHDSATRLATGAPWFAHSNFHLHTRLDQAFTPVIMQDTAFFLLPYFEPVDARIYFDNPDIRTIHDAMPLVIDKMKENFDSQLKQVLISHFFVSGSSRSDSETKVEVGGLDGINGSLLEDFDYVALGHLHNKNALNLANARYSGSPLKYSLSEKEQKKGVWIVETEEKLNLQFIELTPLRELQELQGTFAHFLDPEIYQQLNRENYYSLLLEDRSIIPNMMNQLRKVYPRVLQVERLYGRENSQQLSVKKLKEQTPIELTEEFFTTIVQSAPTSRQQKWIEQTLHQLMKKGGAADAS